MAGRLDTHERASEGENGTAAQILEAASRAIVRHGFASTRISDVAREAGTSTGTVHYHFDTKEDVLVEALRWANESAYDLIDEVLAADGDATAKLGRLIRLSIPYPGPLRDWWVLWIELWTLVPHRPDLRPISERVSRRWREIFASAVQAGVDSGEFRLRVGAVEASERLSAMIDGLAFQAIVEHHGLTPERMLELVVRYAAEEVGAASADIERAALATALP
jgi:AcrR family transcriptional regulator